MSRFLTLVLVVLFTQVASAQKQSTKLPDPKKYAATITTEDLSKHLYIIAGAEMEGRETATEGQRKAAAYIEQQFKSIGLLPGNSGSYQQHFPVYKDEVGSTELVVNGKTYEVGKDFVPFTQWNGNATSYFSEIVFVGHGIVDKEIDDYAKLNVTGKAVLLLDGAPAGFKPSATGFRASTSVYSKIMAARSKGAAAVILAGNNFPRRVSAGGNMYVELYKADQYPNTFTVSDVVAKAIAGNDSSWNAWVNAGKSGKVEGTVVTSNIKLSYTKKTI